MQTEKIWAALTLPVLIIIITWEQSAFSFIEVGAFYKHGSDLRHRLGSRLQVGLSLSAPPSLVKDLLDFFVIAGVELGRPVVQLVQSSGSPDVMHAGHERHMFAGLLVELSRQIGVRLTYQLKYL